MRRKPGSSQVKKYPSIDRSLSQRSPIAASIPLWGILRFPNSLSTYSLARFFTVATGTPVRKLLKCEKERRKQGRDEKSCPPHPRSLAVSNLSPFLVFFCGGSFGKGQESGSKEIESCCTISDMGTPSSSPPPPPVPKRPCTMCCERDNGMLSVLPPHYHNNHFYRCHHHCTTKTCLIILLDLGRQEKRGL